jgi:hypothetical protein
MVMALLGHDGDPDDPIYMGSTLPIETPLGTNHLSQAQIEDLQLWSCLTTLTSVGALPSPVGIAAGDDPPDRILSVGGREYGVELTALTLHDLRRSLADVQSVAREVATALRDAQTAYGHLVGRTVEIRAVDLEAAMSGGAQRTTVVNDILKALREDRGVVEQNLDPNQIETTGWPETLDFSAGNYESFAGLWLSAHQSTAGPDSPAAVIGTANCTFQLNEAQTLLKQRVTAKDRVGNDILAISTGLPGKTGSGCPLDFWIFDALREHGLGGRPQPEHINGILLHHWGTPYLAEIYRNPDNPPPWPPPPSQVG